MTGAFDDAAVPGAEEGIGAGGCVRGLAESSLEPGVALPGRASRVLRAGLGRPRTRLASDAFFGHVLTRRHTDRRCAVAGHDHVAGRRGAPPAGSGRAVHCTKAPGSAPPRPWWAAATASGRGRRRSRPARVPSRGPVSWRATAPVCTPRRRVRDDPGQKAKGRGVGCGAEVSRAGRTGRRGTSPGGCVRCGHRTDTGRPRPVIPLTFPPRRQREGTAGRRRQSPAGDRPP